MSDASLPQAGPATASPTENPQAARYARYVFWLMFVISGLNYLDRWVFTGLAPTIQQDLRLDDFQIGVLTSAFLLVYTVVALPLGFLADRIARKVIVASGVGIWSVATALTGFVSGFFPMLAVRSALGVGEGSYFPAGTPLLAAYFPPSRRATILARWGVGTIIGAGIGFLIASPFASGSDWRYAFFFAAVPGLVVAFLMSRLREKSRHEEDPIAENIAGKGPNIVQRARMYLRIPTVRVIVGVHALGFFGITGITSFFTIYLDDTYAYETLKLDHYGHITGTGPGTYPLGGVSPHLIPILAGGIVLLGGVIGNLYGGVWANKLSRRFTGARVMTGGLGFLLAAPFVILAIGSRYVLTAIPAYNNADPYTQVHIGVGIFIVAGLLAAVFVNVYNGPTTAALLDVVPAAERGAAGGTELALAHLLGDVWAAAAIGGLAVVLKDSLGGEQIGLALLLTCPLALVLSGVVGIWGSRFYARDVAALGASAEQMLGVSSAR